MYFTFTRKFFILLAFGVVPLSLAWTLPMLGYVVLLYDILLVAAAFFDYFRSRNLPKGLSIERAFDGRFAIGRESAVLLRVSNGSDEDVFIRVKDEYPAEMELSGKREAEFELPAGTSAEYSYAVKPGRRGKYSFGRVAVRRLGRFGLVWSQSDLGEMESVKVYPNMARAREIELKALGSRSFVAARRRSDRRGEGREFESMRDYVRGDELRHISWTATARRSRITTRQYQIERDQTVIIALDAGRLMTGRIGSESKFDTAIHAALALMSACAKTGDNCGLAVFGRRVRKFLPPKRGVGHIDSVLEALYDLEPESIEPSYARAFQYISANSKKRAFIVILTDLVDKESSRELITSLKLLRPRHLPLVVTIGDRDLTSAVAKSPGDIRDVFIQSAAEEIIRQREQALRHVESLGGLALDVTTQTLGPKLLETYMRVKERGLL